ncbi:MAG: ABC transporter ATP-binding protein [Planctomycetota bacterium]
MIANTAFLFCSLLMTSPVLLEAHRIGRRRPDGQGWLLEEVSFELRAGHRLAVVGPSGSGKTLFLRSLVLLDRLDEGEIRWLGRPIHRHEVPGLRRQVIYLHQRPALWEETVEDALRQPFSLALHRGRRFDRTEVVRRLQELGRDEAFLTKPLRDLSGGERQITALLRGIGLDPMVLLLDEPTAALDGSATQAVEALVGRWVAESPEPRALVWISHDETQAGRVADTTLRMQSGRLLEELRT